MPKRKGCDGGDAAASSLPGRGGANFWNGGRLAGKSSLMVSAWTGFPLHGSGVVTRARADRREGHGVITVAPIDKKVLRVICCDWDQVEEPLNPRAAGVVGESLAGKTDVPKFLDL
jgi:hypothetical protein